MLNIHLLSKLSLASHGDLSSFSTIPGPFFADSTSSTHLHNIDMSVFNSLLFRTNSIYSPIFPVDCLDVSLPSPGLWYLFDDHFNVFFFFPPPAFISAENQTHYIKLIMFLIYSPDFKASDSNATIILPVS